MAETAERRERKRIWTVLSLGLGLIAVAMVTVTIFLMPSAATEAETALAPGPLMDLAPPIIGAICMALSAVAYFVEEAGGPAVVAAGLGATAVLFLFAWWAPLLVIGGAAAIWFAWMVNE